MLHPREALASDLADLNTYDATGLCVGKSTILTLTGEPATGGACCLPHHVSVDGAYLFAERLLYVNWRKSRRDSLPALVNFSSWRRNDGDTPRDLRAMARGIASLQISRIFDAMSGL
jgi:hypothetical protein